MSLVTSGELKLSQIRSEFGGGSGQIKLGDLYRGGSKVRAKAANNTATNDAASVPTSGAIDFSDFHGTSASFTKTFTTGATNQDASDIFGDDYSVDYDKNIVINSGVELGATSTSQEALHIDSGGDGTITITNNGTLSGAGGSANGGTGGDAFEADIACTLVNNGTMRAGGGGGGKGGNGGSGGTGGQGRTSSQSYSSQATVAGRNVVWDVPSSYAGGRVRGFFYRAEGGGGGRFKRGNSASSLSPYGYCQGGTTLTQKYDGYTSWYTNISASHFYCAQMGYPDSASTLAQQLVTSYTYYNGGSGGSGGSGGNGGVGQGFGQSAGSGSSGSGGSGGSGGGTNAGNGGTGGTGGTGGSGGSFGSSGSSGNTGSSGNSGGNGNYQNGSGGSGGSGGSSGGNAGKYLNGQSNVTFQNNGTVQGGIS